jgi:hypothetical protein
MRFFDANANFAYELLTSINRYSQRPATAKMQTPNATRGQGFCPIWLIRPHAQPCDSSAPRVASLCEKACASAASFTAFACSAKSRSRDATERS